MSIDGDQPDTHDLPLDGEAEREQTFLRRSLLKAGWIVPAVVVLDQTPAFAQGSAAPHTDVPGVPHTDTLGGHVDVPAVDQQVPHVDIPNQHVDVIPPPVHIDLPASPPNPHVDFINEPPHQDSQFHTDVPPSHVDTPHDDTPGTGPHTDIPAQPHIDA